MTAAPATLGAVRAAAVAAAADAACVVLFVAVGRRDHDEDPGLGGTLLTAAPFLIGLSIGWLATPGARARPASVRTGIGIWVATVVLGLVLRRTAFGRGTALAFVIVAATVLGAALVGWRAIVSDRRRRVG